MYMCATDSLSLVQCNLHPPFCRFVRPMQMHVRCHLSAPIIPAEAPLFCRTRGSRGCTPKVELQPKSWKLHLYWKKPLATWRDMVLPLFCASAPGRSEPTDNKSMALSLNQKSRERKALRAMLRAL